MPKTKARFLWPEVYESEGYALVGSRLFEPYLEERRSQNATAWNEGKNWRFGFYFGRYDTRLWVPRRLANGMARDEDRVINFSHPLGRKAFRILMLGYGIGLISAGIVISALLGVRW